MDNYKCRGVFRTWSNILRWSFLCKLIKGCQTLNIFAKGSILNAWFLWTYFISYSLLGRNKEFCRAGKFFWNNGTSTNISSITHERKAPHGKISKFFLLDTLKTKSEVRNLTCKWSRLSHFFPKTRPLFSNFKKGQGDLRPTLVVSFVYILLINFMPLASFYTY